MNWGKGITIALIMFIGFIVSLGVILMQQNVDLVAEDYYQQEIDYETQISAESNAKKLDEQPSFAQDETYFIVNIPEGEFTNMTVELSRPNNSDKDQTFDIVGTKMFMIEKSNLEVGQYGITLRYDHEGKPCQQKTSVFIQK
ncbi:MAG: FixH family protein [bacterium]|nr:FixH family protein [bacterium]